MISTLMTRAPEKVLTSFLACLDLFHFCSILILSHSVLCLYTSPFSLFPSAPSLSSLLSFPIFLLSLSLPLLPLSLPLSLTPPLSHTPSLSPPPSLPPSLSLYLCLLPSDTFASKVAAIQDQYADASIGNVTGSNAVNVFLGIGVAWTIAAVYWQSKGKPFLVPPGSLAFSVTLFTILALVCVTILLYRRRPGVAGAELGGPRTAKLITTAIFVSFWLLYILMSSLDAYCYLPTF